MTFQGRADSRVAVTFVSTTILRQCGLVSLIALHESTVDTGALANGAGVIASTALPADGVYALVADPVHRSTGAIAFTVSS